MYIFSQALYDGMCRASARSDENKGVSRAWRRQYFLSYRCIFLFARCEKARLPRNFPFSCCIRKFYSFLCDLSIHILRGVNVLNLADIRFFQWLYAKRRDFLYYKLWPRFYKKYSKKPIDEKKIVLAYSELYKTMPDNLVYNTTQC